MMRIITGSAKGKKLETLAGETTRPTSQRMKEAIFSAIQFDLQDRTILDLFAGCGQLGLEALSRGAASAMFVDASAEAVALIKKNAQHVGFFDRSRFLISDYRNYIRKAAEKEKFDLVFIDPPYALNAVSDALRRLIRANLLVNGALIVTESGVPDIFEGDAALQSCFADIRHKSYGPSHIHIMNYVAQKNLLNEGEIE